METHLWDKALRENLAANPLSPFNPYPGSLFLNFTGNPNSAVTPVRPPPSLAPLCLNGSRFEGGESTSLVHPPMNPMPPPAPVTTSNLFVGRQAGQPVDFNDAISYVNKIKNRFNSEPDKYKQFLGILHAYQKEQQNPYGFSANQIKENEVYYQVAKLFENQEDLLREFGYFLPDATPPPLLPPPPVISVTTAEQNHNCDQEVPVVETNKPEAPRQEGQSVAPVQQTTPKPVSSTPRKSLVRGQAAASTKKAKCTSIFKDINLAEAGGTYGTLNDFAFFDKVRHLLRSQDVYENFLRILLLFNNEVFSKSEVLQLATPFLSQAPELLAWFKEFLGHNNPSSPQQCEPVQSVSEQEKLTGNSEEQVLKIDFSSCKRVGTSYWALPKNYTPPKCSGRTSLCREVLNDAWVSFPTSSEDSTFVTSKTSQLEEYTYRCEDERFELDIVIETNAETIRCLEVVHRKMSRMSPEELQEFQLDDCLGGTSQTIHQLAIRRLYGEKASYIIEGLQKSPEITVPLVLKRLKAKEEEWMEAQKEFNKVGREQAEHFFLKSLDPQRVSKTLLNGSGTIHDEGQQQNIVEMPTNSQSYEGPHLNLQQRDRLVLDDACNLLLHHIRRQTSIEKKDKRKIKKILKHLDLGPLKDGERNSGPGRRSNGSKSKKEDETENNETGPGPGPSGASKDQAESRRISRRGLKISSTEGKIGKGRI